MRLKLSSGRRDDARGKKSRPKVVLVFGEDDNDRETLRQLAVAIRPDTPKLEKRRKPLVLMRDREAAARKKNADGIAAQVKRDQKRFDVRGLIAHQDCDAIEPAHEALAQSIRSQLSVLDVPIVAATPAWEMETWLYLWPDAAPAHVVGWRRPARTGANVGKLTDAKERYRRDVRPLDKRVRDYVESDAPHIVKKAQALQLINKLDAKSESYIAFRDELLAARF